MTALSRVQSQSFSKSLFKELIVRSWWVYAFAFICLISFSIAFKHLDSQFQSLKENYIHLESTKNSLKRKQSQLSFQIQSLDDQKSVEMILKKELGLISDGQTKVYFVNPN